MEDVLNEVPRRIDHTLPTESPTLTEHLYDLTVTEAEFLARLRSRRIHLLHADDATPTHPAAEAAHTEEERRLEAEASPLLLATYDAYVRVFGRQKPKGWSEFVHAPCGRTLSYNEYFTEVRRDMSLLAQFHAAPERSCADCGGRYTLYHRFTSFCENVAHTAAANGHFLVLTRASEPTPGHEEQVVGFMSGYPVDDPVTIWDEHAQEFASSSSYERSYLEHLLAAVQALRRDPHQEGHRRPVELLYADELGVVERSGFRALVPLFRALLDVMQPRDEQAAGYLVFWTSRFSNLYRLSGALGADELFSHGGDRVIMGIACERLLPVVAADPHEIPLLLAHATRERHTQPFPPKPAPDHPSSSPEP